MICIFFFIPFLIYFLHDPSQFIYYFISELCYTFLFYSFNCKHGWNFCKKISNYSNVFMENLLILGFVPVYHSRRKPLLQRSFSTTSYYCSSDNENIVNAEPTEQEEDYHNIIKDTERSKGELRCNFYWI